MTPGFDPEFYGRVKQDNEAAGRPFTPSKAVWRAANEDIMRVMKSEGLVEVETQYINERFSIRRDHNHRCYAGYLSHMCSLDKTDATGSSLYERACRKLLDHLRQTDVHGLLNSTQATSGNAIVIDGKLVSWDYLMSVHTVNVIAGSFPHILHDKATVMDMGPGWGRIGHILLQVNPNLTYVVLDLPEGLMAVRHNMKRLFPDVKYIDYDDVAALDTIGRADIEGASLVFGGSHHLPKFKDDTIDVFISINSMQEMDPGDQEMYLEMLEHRTKGAYIMAHESEICGKRKRFGDYMWPSTWNVKKHTPAGQLFFYPDFFETVLSR